MNTASIPLVELEPDETINARRTKSDEGIAELKASILAHGLIQALRVRHDEDTGKKKIIAGNRRYRVLCELAADGEYIDGVRVDDAFPVPVIFGDVDDTTARELSQAENFIRLPQHEADTYETFRELADRGLDEKQIAARFGIEPQRVRKMLALGRLSPVILEAWRTGEFARDVTECVRAFTLAPSIEEQERVFHALKKKGWLYAHQIKAELGADDRKIGQRLDLVGKAAYVAAGGQIIEDLWGENHVVSDPALLAKMVADKLQTKIDEALKEGWSWAALADDLPPNWNWNWQKLGLSKKKATKEQKAQSGVVVGLDYHGKLEISYGVVKPEERKAEKGTAGSKEKSAPTISNAMMHRLSIQVTQAARVALTDEPRVGLVALLAGFLTRHDGPVKVSTNGMGGYVEGEKFATAFARLQDMSDDDLFRFAAGIAGRALDMQTQNALRRPLTGGAELLVAAIDANRMTAALRETWDAVDYFGGVAKPFVIQAIREAVNEDEARKADKLKKKELVEFAVKNVQPTGWLPPELRCATYSGPGEVPKLQVEASPIDDDPELDEDDIDENAHLEDDEMEAAE